MEYAVRQRPFRGEEECGDRCLVLGERNALVIVADGLGHGPKAAEAATVFCDLVAAMPDMALDLMMERASASMSQTRGAAAAIVKISADGRLSFTGVGNVEMHSLSRERIRPVCMPGIVGHRVRKIRVFEYDVNPGELFVLHTDGISSRFDLSAYRSLSVDEAAERILEEHGKWHDDATCVVFKIS